MNRTLQIAVIVFDGVNAVDVTGPVEAFAAVRALDGSPVYTATCWSMDGLTVSAESGLKFTAESPIPEIPEADLLIIPGGAGLREPERLKRAGQWLRQHHGCFKRVVSVCTGAYALAASGLIDGRRVTTHWNFAADLARSFPAVRVNCDALFIKDNKYYSSGGISAGIDLALSIIEEDFGAKAATAAARELVVFLRRTGSQSQFSSTLKVQSMATDRLAEVCLWATNNLSGDLSLETLARRANLSVRQFCRKFKAVYGTAPAGYFKALRLDAARDALSGSGAGLDEIARYSGFDSPDGFRRAFEKRYRINPGEYRKRFSEHSEGLQ